MQEGAERIVRRILDDADAKAEEIKTEAAEKAEAIEVEAGQKAARRREHVLKQAQKEAEEQKRRIIGVAQLEARKELLAAKQELISEAFRKALDQLVEMDDSSYFSTIRDLLLNFVESGTEKVVFSAGDLERLPENFLEDINTELAGQGEKGELALSNRPGDIRGGFILQAEGVELNCTFESLLTMKRDELEPEVAAMLFK